MTIVIVNIFAATIAMKKAAFVREKVAGANFRKTVVLIPIALHRPMSIGNAMRCLITEERAIICKMCEV